MPVATYYGDPDIETDGLSFDFVDVTGGQPSMDTGLKNAVSLSLFTPTTWWGNSITGQNEEIRGALTPLLRNTLTNKTRLDMEAAATKGLAWLVESGVAKKVTVSAIIPLVGWMYIEILIEQPDRVVEVRYQINWAQMAIISGVS